VANLRDAAGRARLVHVSTNYVFFGTRPVAEGGYIESDSPAPVQEYGKSKLAGEAEVGEDGLVIRTAGLYGGDGAASKGGSFVDRMLAREGTIRMVADQYINPTSTVDLARAMIECWLEGETGVAHLVNHGGCSWFDFTAEILRLAGRSNRLEPVSTEPDAVPLRPLNGLLESTRGLPAMEPWQQALAGYLDRA
jgi:dTDP-4-dehydrorhamnose reductase